jgi:hypothetical protein
MRYKRIFFHLLLFIAFFCFTADILDLREELHFIKVPYSTLDNNISTGLACQADFESEPAFGRTSAYDRSSVTLSFFHLLPYGLRAPPARS